MKQLNHYKVLKKLGSGGMGVVYHAFDTRLERDVALKLMHPHLLENERHAQRLVREAQAVAKIVHPNIVTIYEIGEAEQGRYISMEFADGIPFGEVVDSEDGLSTERVIRLLVQILGGLECAHQKGVFHRDIKPDNVLVCNADTVKILDFGIARISAKEGLTAVGDVLGTIEYMAPEQMLGEDTDHRSDLYSAGVLLYHALTKKLPFTGSTSVAVLFKQLNEDPLPPSTFNGEVSAELDSIVLKALAKEKDHRWEDAGAFREALMGLLEEQKSVSRPLQTATDWGFPDEPDEIVVSKDRLNPVFIGREQESKVLVRYLQQAQQGKGGTVVISGEAGVGKSTLARQLQTYARSQKTIVLYGASLYQEGMDAYMPYIDALRGFFAKDSHKLPPEERTKIKSLVREKIPVLMEFTERFSTTFDNGSYREADEEQDSVNILEGIHLLISLISTIHPVVLVIDDMQWADEASLRLFHYLSRHISDNQILQIGISRTDRFDLQQNGKPTAIVEIFSRMRREDVFHEIHLNQFPRETCEVLIDESIGASSFSDEFYSMMHRETKGNPFFILETLKMLIDTEVIYHESGIWHHKKELSKFQVPNRVEDVFVRQFRELAEDEREILQIASVIGYKFDISVLSRVLDIKKIQLLKTLKRFQTDFQIINSNEDGFQFEHPMLKDILYNDVPTALRREYHLMIAEEFEQIHGPEFGAIVGEVATHFKLGGNDAKAMPLLYNASLRAFKIAAYRQASMFLEGLMEIREKTNTLPQGATLSELYLKLAICYEEIGYWEKSHKTYQALLELSEENQDPKGQIDALRRMGRIHDQQNKWDKALENYERCLKILDKHSVINVRSIIYNNIGLIHFQRGDYDLSREFLEKTIEAVDCEEGKIDIAHASANLGIIANIHGNYQQALDYYQKALDFYESHGSMRQTTRVYHNMGMAYTDMEKWDESIEAFGKCLDLLDTAENKQLRGLTYLNMGKAYARQGKLFKAQNLTNKAHKLFIRLADNLSTAEVFHVLGFIHGEKQDFKKAEDFLDRSIKLNQEHEYREGLAESYLTYARLMVKAGDNDRCRKYLKQSVIIFRELNLQSRAESIQKEFEQFIITDKEIA